MTYNSMFAENTVIKKTFTAYVRKSLKIPCSVRDAGKLNFRPNDVAA